MIKSLSVPDRYMKLKTWPKGRRCKTRGCGTILSIHNYTKYCSACRAKDCDAVMTKPYQKLIQ